MPSRPDVGMLVTWYWFSNQVLEGGSDLTRLSSLLYAVIALTDHPVCGQNFTYDACDTTCGAVSCREHLGDMKSECRACVSGCRCKDNYVRLGDKCVLRSDCKSWAVIYTFSKQNSVSYWNFYLFSSAVTSSLTRAPISVLFLLLFRGRPHWS